MSGNSNVSDGELFFGNWNSKQNMEAYDRLRPEFRAAIAYADDRYSIEELFTAPDIRRMTHDELLTFLWEHSDGFEIRYPYHVRIQYERARAASYRNHYGCDWVLRGDSVEIFHGRSPSGPVR